MGLPAYLTLGGIKGPVGAGRGTSTPNPRQGQILVFGYAHVLDTEIDTKSGKATDERRHGVLVIRKNVDFASPFIHEAHTRNDPIDPWQLDLFRTPRAGRDYNYLSVTLTKARVVSYRTVMPPLTHPDTANVHEYEEIGFAYESIAWTNKKASSEFGETESQGFKTWTASVVKPRFEPDWVEENAKTAVLAAHALLADAAKAAVFFEAKRKWEEGK